MKIVVLNHEKKPSATFEWLVARGQWSATFDDEVLETWWPQDEYCYEAHFHNVTDGHFSFFWGSHRIFNLRQKGYEALVVDWKDWDLIKLDLEKYYKVDEFQDVEEKKLLKAKIYLKPGEKPPKGLEVRRGPKGGLYYETKFKVAPKKVPDWKFLSVDAIARHLSTLTQKELHSLIDHERTDVREEVARRLDEKALHQMLDDDDYYIRRIVANRITPKELLKLINDPIPAVRVNVAKRIDEKELYRMINDESAYVRWEVASRIDQKGLHQLRNDEATGVRAKVAERIDQSGLHELINDENESVRKIVTKRIDQSGLHKMINDKSVFIRENVVERIDNVGLSKMLNDVSVRSRVKVRQENIKKISDIVAHYKNTGEIKLNDYAKNLISNIMIEGTRSIHCIDLIDEFYKQINFDYFHSEAKAAWESSSSSDLAGVLKDSIMRQYGGIIQHHDEIKENWNEYVSRLYKTHDKAAVDEYAKIHKTLIHSCLDVMFPNQDTITLYRGTTSNEIFTKNEKIKIKSNPLSSWTLHQVVANKFKERKLGVGIILKAEVPKADIWSCFLSHAYEGSEREFLVISPKDRDGEVIK